MGTFEFVFGFGVGVVVAKLIDAAWIQPFLAKKEHNSWLRDRRLEAYTELCRNLLALSLEGKQLKTPFENYSIAARSLLLVRDKALAERIDTHIANRDRLFRISDGGENPGEGETEEGLYKDVYDEARELVEMLRNEVHEPRMWALKCPFLNKS